MFAFSPASIFRLVLLFIFHWSQIRVDFPCLGPSCIGSRKPRSVNCYNQRVQNSIRPRFIFALYGRAIVQIRSRFNRALFETPRSGNLPPLTLPVYEPLIEPELLSSAASDGIIIARQSLFRNVVSGEH